jgi:hypothetical protein
MKHLEITSPFWILTPPVKMVLCQLTYTTNRQINISTCPHRVVILNIAPKVFRTAKLSESNASAPLAVGIAVYDEYFSCMCAAEFLCALDVFARHTSSRITFLTLTIVGRSRGDVSSHQDVFQTFGFPEGQDGWFFEDFTQVFNTSEKLNNNLVNA